MIGAIVLTKREKIPFAVRAGKAVQTTKPGG
jgi:hypothetical protein